MRWIETFFVASVMLSARPAYAEDAVAAARAHRDAHGPDILREFAELLSLPNVASDSAGIRQNAAWIRAHFETRGVSMSLLEVPGAPPALLGRLDTPGATRTLGIYVHYDGQPPGTEPWLSDPWTPTLYTGVPKPGTPTVPFPKPGDPIDPEWRLMARSAGDDKAPLVAILAALDALRSARIPLSSNLLFFFEGEEEAGSPHLGEFMSRYRDRIQVDAWLFCDGPVHQSRRPLLAFGVRGVTGLEMTVYGSIRGLHSGHYGNWAPNPGMVLARLLAGMKDSRGRVQIRGFYDSVVPLGRLEKRALAEAPPMDDALLAELQLQRPEGDRPLVESLLVPSLNVRGIRSGDVGRDTRNVIPATATASLEMRLVKGNDPEAMIDLVEAHLVKQGATIVRADPDSATRVAHPLVIKVTRESGYPAVRTPMDDPIAGRLQDAAERASGEKVVMLPTLGGSLPLYLFTETWKKPLVIVPIANHDDEQHAPNENLRIANLWYGIDLYAAIFSMPDRS